MRIARTVFPALALFACTATAQTTPTWDISGNSLLNGNYNFRQVVYLTTDQDGTIGQELALYGTISFDGNGNYTINGTQIDSLTNNGAPQTLSVTGTYGISASGLGSMDNPSSNGDSIYGLVSNGIFIGSSTESAFNDLFIAAPTSSATNTTFAGSYWVTDMDVPSSDFTQIRDAWYQLNPDGAGNLGTVSVNGYIAGNGSSTVTQSLSSVSYSFSGGVGTIAYPSGTLTNSNLIQGNKTLYISPNENFVFGGSPSGYDMFVGVLATSNVTQSQFSGIYYTAGIDQDASQVSSGLSSIDTYYGSLVPTQGLEIGHQRINAVIYAESFDYTFDDTFTLDSDGTSSDSFQNYWVGAEGAIRVGVGPSPYLGLSVAVRSPSFKGSGVYINPTGVVNAASSAPFTAGLSQGEFVSLYGTGLASTPVVANQVPFTTSLGGVQVMVNGVAAPLYLVSPTQLSFLIPYATTPIASIQVINNGVASNTVTSYMSFGSPGAFTIPAGGVYQAAVLHQDSSLVSESSPAQVGETLQFFVAGLGDVSPAISDGAAGPVPLSYTTDSILVYIDGVQADVTFSGLAPYEVGLYQLNVLVPSGIDSGDVYVDISGSDSYTSEAYIPVASGTGTTGASVVRKSGTRVRRPGFPKPSSGKAQASLRTGKRPSVTRAQ